MYTPFRKWCPLAQNFASFVLYVSKSCKFYSLGQTHLDFFVKSGQCALHMRAFLSFHLMRDYCVKQVIVRDCCVKNKKRIYIYKKICIHLSFSLEFPLSPPPPPPPPPPPRLKMTIVVVSW
ncbi:hypothetical protein Hanom_Chr01g00046391 [Helianthus anomalus]